MRNGFSRRELTAILPRHSLLSGKQLMRDVWQRRNQGWSEDFEQELPSHGSVFLKIGTPKTVVCVNAVENR